MGRNPKQGIDYFPADVDMFQDRKIKRLLRSAGGKGLTIYIYLLTEIYRDKGYYYAWDTHSAFDISDDLNFSEAVVEETVKACCSIGLFNEDLYAERSVISSESIQNRWQKIVTEANRVETNIESEYKIMDGEPLFLRVEKGLSGEETPEKCRVMQQSKEKERKGEKSKYYIPDREDVEGYFEKRGDMIPSDIPLEAEKFINHYEEKEWKASDGKRIKYWKKRAATWNTNYQQYNEDRIKKYERSQKDRHNDSKGSGHQYSRNSLESVEDG